MQSSDTSKPRDERSTSTHPHGEKVSLDRHDFTATNIVHDIWRTLELPSNALGSLQLTEHEDPILPSSFKIGTLAQATLALSALTAALNYATRKNSSSIPRVDVLAKRAVTEFISERLHVMENPPKPYPWEGLGGLHKTSDGYVRIHDGFPNHAYGTLDLLSLPRSATREDLAARVAQWTSIDLESYG
jgi:hypothetical protein